MKGIPQGRNTREFRQEAVIEGPWAEAYNTNLDRSLFRAERYRMQLPLQKVSYNMKVAQEIETRIKEMAPDRKLQPVLTYAKGNQVVAECILSWTEGGVYEETPFIAFLLFDKDGLIIRDRSYITLDHWPGAAEVAKRLGVELPES